MLRHTNLGQNRSDKSERGRIRVGHFKMSIVRLRMTVGGGGGVEVGFV